jgi:hypothetical protein
MALGPWQVDIRVYFVNVLIVAPKPAAIARWEANSQAHEFQRAGCFSTSKV